MIKTQKPRINLQDQYLNHLRKNKAEVEIKLLDGAKLKGYIRGFDNYVLLFEDSEGLCLIYKHALAGVSFSAQYRLTFNMRAPNSEYGE